MESTRVYFYATYLDLLYRYGELAVSYSGLTCEAFKSANCLSIDSVDMEYLNSRNLYAHCVINDSESTAKS